MKALSYLPARIPCVSAAGTIVPTSAPRRSIRASAAVACPICTDPANRGRMRRLAPWYALATLVVLLDQLTKFWISVSFQHPEARAGTAFFNLVLAYNTGAAFSFLASASGW